LVYPVISAARFDEIYDLPLSQFHFASFILNIIHTKTTLLNIKYLKVGKTKTKNPEKPLFILNYKTPLMMKKPNRSLRRSEALVARERQGLRDGKGAVRFFKI